MKILWFATDKQPSFLREEAQIMDEYALLGLMRLKIQGQRTNQMKGDPLQSIDELLYLRGW